MNKDSKYGNFIRGLSKKSKMLLESIKSFWSRAISKKSINILTLISTIFLIASTMWLIISTDRLTEVSNEMILTERYLADIGERERVSQDIETCNALLLETIINKQLLERISDIDCEELKDGDLVVLISLKDEVISIAKITPSFGTAGLKGELMTYALLIENTNDLIDGIRIHQERGDKYYKAQYVDYLNDMVANLLNNQTSEGTNVDRIINELNEYHQELVIEYSEINDRIAKNSVSDSE